MLGSPSPATASIHTSTSSATPTSPTRPSRLRGLSYLRTYTHNHLHGSTTPRAETPPPERSPLTRSTSYPATHSRSNSGSANGASGIQSAENGWLPTVQGRSGLSREGTTQTSTAIDPASPTESQPTATASGMTRSRAATVLGPTTAGAVAGGNARITTTAEGASSTDAGMAATAEGSSGKETQPTIRFIPHVETRSTRPSLSFIAVSRTLKGPNTIVRVGRYSERDTATADENTLPVGFKSKVVSRRHCEFWCTNGQWFVKDVKSSSGTFLNHVRLSSPGSESRPYPVNDGDVVQLGIDFKGGEEVIFRCVKIRIECNRGWQKTLNQFNTSTHKRLLKNALGSKNRDSDAASVNSSECSICLNPVAPCQALFVAPCSHVWHFKCVRNLINSNGYPNFLCPNCRFVADLEADVEPPEEEELYEEFPPATIKEESGEAEQSGETGVSSDDAHDGAAGSISTSDEDHEEDMATPNGETQIDNIDRTANITDEELAGLLSSASVNTPTASSALRSPLSDDATPSGTAPRPINRSSTKQRTTSSDLLGARSTTPTSTLQFALAAGVVNDGPMTPRNDAGPFVFDGSPTADASPRQVAQDGERHA